MEVLVSEVITPDVVHRVGDQRLHTHTRGARLSNTVYYDGKLGAGFGLLHNGGTRGRGVIYNRGGGIYKEND